MGHTAPERREGHWGGERESGSRAQREPPGSRGRGSRRAEEQLLTAAVAPAALHGSYGSGHHSLQAMQGHETGPRGRALAWPVGQLGTQAPLDWCASRDQGL